MSNYVYVNGCKYNRFIVVINQKIYTKRILFSNSLGYKKETVEKAAGYGLSESVNVTVKFTMYPVPGPVLSNR